MLHEARHVTVQVESRTVNLKIHSMRDALCEKLAGNPTAVCFRAGM